MIGFTIANIPEKKVTRFESWDSNREDFMKMLKLVKLSFCDIM